MGATQISQKADNLNFQLVKESRPNWRKETRKIFKGLCPDYFGETNSKGDDIYPGWNTMPFINIFEC